ncbi:autotransporter secretion outer membrane protein TamA [Rubellimicrobium thermophilum DSM 16684]|uniref:Autotransporter secretion outer membrane protein TamA n=1 Tax=Rubellimicrobium thermophilum DSM 16684 TaxID=1123069 RepID=S9QYM6_9RHOB|nr:BamA/TamA family outer membrane protein [Rubellimicrobium thermophilum]EPX84687.1 autotransporter secretion outer membrane protein TamA [Rubellimicrobium thermophilum DSM 16684]
MPRHALLALALLAAVVGTAVRAQDFALMVPEGTGQELRRALEGASLTLALSEEDAAAPQDIVAAARADYRRLLTALYAEGHYGGTVSITIDGREASAILPLAAPRTVERVVLAVDPGPVFTFGETVIGPLAPGTTLPEDFAAGAIARSETLRAASREAIAAWRQAGHAKAGIGGQEIVARHPQGRLDARLAIDPGPALTFGPVSVSGNARVRTDRILAIAGIPTGARFDPDELDRAAARLRRSGAFNAVALVESETWTPELTLPIAIQTTEALPRRFGFGAEISSADGLSANAFWLHRNLLGGAERLRIEGEIANIEGGALGLSGGGADYALGASFARPATLDPDTDLILSTRLAHQDEQDYRLDRLSFDVGLTRHASETLTLTAAAGLLVAREERAAGSRRYTLLTLPLGAERDRRDDPRDPRGGFYLDLEAMPFLTVAGDSGSGLRLMGDARAYRSLGEAVTLAGRVQAGSVIGPDPVDAPADFLFFSGGGGTVRGQPYQALGVTTTVGSTDLRTGGASFLGFQGEGRIDLRRNIQAAAFADFGFVGPDPVPSDEGDWHAGLGIGARYLSPVGPIRVDLATPATGDDAFSRVFLYIGIGQAF